MTRRRALLRNLEGSSVTAKLSESPFREGVQKAGVSRRGSERPGLGNDTASSRARGEQTHPGHRVERIKKANLSVWEGLPTLFARGKGYKHRRPAAQTSSPQGQFPTLVRNRRLPAVNADGPRTYGYASESKRICQREIIRQETNSWREGHNTFGLLNLPTFDFFHARATVPILR
jgi:hypothetical protein